MCVRLLTPNHHLDSTRLLTKTNHTPLSTFDPFLGWGSMSCLLHFTYLQTTAADSAEQCTKFTHICFFLQENIYVYIMFAKRNTEQNLKMNKSRVNSIPNINMVLSCHEKTWFSTGCPGAGLEASTESPDKDEWAQRKRKKHLQKKNFTNANSKTWKNITTKRTY